MATFYTTTGLSHQLEQLIKNAKERLILISPFLKVNPRIRELLEDRDRLKIDIRIICRPLEKPQSEGLDWIQPLRFIRVGYCPNLHAKCYLSEEEALVASMNLYEFSQQNNNEMGIGVSRTDDPILYRDIYDECLRLVRTSTESPVFSPNSAKEPTKKKKSAAEPTPESPAEQGYCIRCAGAIRLDRERPYCDVDYSEWKKYRNYDYVDTYCHACRKEHPASMKRPLCRECYSRLA